MKTVWTAARSAFAFAWKFGLIALAIALLASMPKEGVDVTVATPERASEDGAPGPAADGVAYVTMKRAASSQTSHCTLLDEDGGELLRVSYDRHGYMHLAWGERFSARPSVTTTKDGWLGLNFRTNGVLCNLLRQPDGDARLELSGLAEGRISAFRITATGEVVRIPPEGVD
jgi:hypothetical protein